MFTVPVSKVIDLAGLVPYNISIKFNECLI